MHPKLLTFRYKLFRYRKLEQELVGAARVQRILDVGCGDGENLQRFKGLPVQRIGVEVSRARLLEARRHGLSVVQGSGTCLPLPGESVDLIYIAHVLHHVADYRRVLGELRRVLASGGTVFVVETVTDHPLLRLARKIRPQWRGDAVEVSWRYEELAHKLEDAGFNIEQSDRYNLVFFLWEMLPLAFWPFELFTPLFVYLDLLLARILRRYSAHCYFVLRDAGANP